MVPDILITLRSSARGCIWFFWISAKNWSMQQEQLFERSIAVVACLLHGLDQPQKGNEEVFLVGHANECGTSC